MSTQRWFLPAGAASAALALTGTTVLADDAADQAALADQVRQLQAQLAEQQAQIAQLRQGETEAWLSERRREEVKGLIHEVLADADSRATLLDEGMTAGYDRGFFLASADGNFRLRVGVESQLRYMFNSSEQDAGVDEDEFGFQIRQARLDFRGHAINPDFTYRLRLAANRSGGDVAMQVATLGYAFNEDWSITAGRFKPGFLREENVSGFQQLAAERSYLADYFTVDYSEGVELAYAVERFRAQAAIHDGSYSSGTDFNNDRTDTAVVGRIEYVAAGNFKQFGDFTSWSGDEFGLLLGAALAYDIGESGGADVADVFKYTLDASAEFGGANLFAAVVGQSFSGDTDGVVDLGGVDQFGVVIQGGVFVVPDRVELFGRYEWMDFDGAVVRANGTSATDDDDLSIITIGGNYYFQKHAAKFTLDLQYALDPVPFTNTVTGLIASDDDDQIAVRGQFQFSF